MFKFKRITVFIIMIALTMPFIAACTREDKYAGALKIGTAELAKTLMPYASTSSANLFIAGKVYHTLLGSTAQPAGAKDGDFVFPDGEVYVSDDIEENYFKFADSLVEKDGAYPKKGNSQYGWHTFNPTEEQYQKQLENKNIVKGKTETGLPLEETDAEFEIRSEEKVPRNNWIEYTFKVRDGYTWNDGEVFTAYDIDFTFKYIQKYKGQLASAAVFLGNFFASEALNDGEFKLTLATNKISDIKTICNSIPVLPQHIWSKISKPVDQKNLNPVGTGAYLAKSEDYIEDASITLTYRDDFNKLLEKELFAGEPIKQIMIKRIANQDVLLSAIQLGDIDVSLDSLDISKATAISGNESYSNVELSSMESSFVTTLALNVGKYGAFNSAKLGGKADDVRRAISLALNQQEIIDDVYFGQGLKVGSGLVPESYPHALRDDEGNYKHKKSDSVLANQLLDEAGFTKDATGMRDLSFEVLASKNNEPLVRTLNNILKREIGITLNFILADSEYSEKVKQSNNADFDMIINSVSFKTDQLLMFDARFGIQPSGIPRLWNVTGVTDKTLIALMRDADIETDYAEQLRKSQLVQNRLSELHVEIPLLIQKAYSVYSNANFTGWLGIEAGSILNGYSLKYIKAVK